MSNDLQFRHEVIDPDPPGEMHDITLIGDINGDGRNEIVIGGKDAWTAVRMVGYNHYGNKKSFYTTPLKYKDWGRINVHSKGSARRKGAEEGTAQIRTLKPGSTC